MSGAVVGFAADRNAPRDVSVAADTPQPAASFTAVPVAGETTSDADLQPSVRRAERRSPQHRVHDAAVHTVLCARHWVLATLVPPTALLLGCEWYRHGTLARPWPSAVLMAALAGILLVVLGPGARKARDTRRLAGLAGAPLLVLALAPWTAQPLPSPGDSELLIAMLLAVAAPAAACMLAPLRGLALGAALLPLSAAGAGFTATPLTQAVALPDVLGSLAASAMAIGLALFEHRRWQLATRALLEQEERLRTIEAARDAAIRADQEKSRFLAIASHDLRQPVHAIGLFAATLGKRLEGCAEEPLVRNLSAAIDGLDRSFNVMLDISRLDAGAIEPRVQQFPLRDLFRRLHMQFAGQAEQKGLGLRFSPGGKSINSDPQLLERVLGNLVQNALRYTERGGIVVVARSTATHVNVEVWDSGVGIRAADLPRIFDEYFQAGQGQRLRTQGLGMGLAIVKRLVRLLGHGLTVVSRPGRGTMFRLSVALGGLPDMQDITAAADTVPMPIPLPCTVLVVDDEEPIRAGLCLLLREWGYDAVGAGSLDEAAQVLRELELPPDLILCDLHLGDGPDGIAVIKAVRQACGSSVAAMLITGDTSHAEIRRAAESGHPVLFKPVRPRALYDALRGIVS